MTALHKNDSLVSKIYEIFSSGFNLDANVQHYITSTFGDFSHQTLKTIFSDVENCERESLLELIIFPNIDIQIQVEEILSEHSLTGKDELEVLKALMANEVYATILLPDPSEKISIPVDELSLSRFLSRLNLSKVLDSQLATAINNHVNKKNQLPVKVKFRNARFEFTPQRIDFLCDFFYFYNPEQLSYFDHLDFIIAFLHEHDENQDIYTALNAKKMSCYGNLKSALKFQEQLQKYNIETLMMKGIRNQSVNIEEVEETIQMIHNITLTIFGRTENENPLFFQ